MEVLFSEPFYSFLFIGAGLILLMLEVFIPSGGILGLLALGCAAFGIYGLFYQGNALLGVGAIGGTSVAVILGIRFGLSRLSFKGSLSATTCTSVDERIEDLVGKEGAPGPVVDRVMLNRAEVDSAGRPVPRGDKPLIRFRGVDHRRHKGVPAGDETSASRHQPRPGIDDIGDMTSEQRQDPPQV